MKHLAGYLTIHTLVIAILFYLIGVYWPSIGQQVIGKVKSL